MALILPSLVRPTRTERNHLNNVKNKTGAERALLSGQVLNKPLSEKTILIVGLGLIGGSVARGLKSANPKQRILATDLDLERLIQAESDGVVDASGDLTSLCPQADIIVIALPTLGINTILPLIADSVNSSAVITDVASVKSHLMLAVNEQSEDFQRRFVPGHPIAGSEKTGYQASSIDLFQRRNVILTPQLETDTSAIAAINDLWRALGANVLGMSLARHDEVLAATSHLPHLLAFAIVDVLVKQERSEDIFRYAAGGFADFSRLASSDARMWSDIFVANADATIDVLEDYIAELVELKGLLKARDHEQMMKVFTRAKRSRDNFVSKYFKPSSQQTMSTDQLIFTVTPGGQINGKIRVPGDKSISHRSIIFGAIAEGVTRVSGFLEGEDALNTVAAFREMGVTITGPENGELTIFGVGKHGLKAPRTALNMGNSGTAMRLLAGLLAAQSFDSELGGDESLSQRPMNRVARPLAMMGANIETDENGTPPLRVTGSRLKGIEYHMPMASAQVKSCLLLAGLYAEGITKIIEPAPCRDHTERMLKGFGYPSLEVLPANSMDSGSITLEGGHDLRATDIDVPADISSAAFFLVAAAITPGSSLMLEHVGTNPTRIGIINLLLQMGANIEFHNERLVGGESVADLSVEYRPLHGIVIPQEQIPLAIDEFPALFIAAACAEGETILHGAEELRVKESDRIEAMASGLAILGIETETFADGIRIEGGQIGGGAIDSHGDHRIAMAFTVAALRASEPITVINCANVATSFPGFVELAQSVGIQVSALGGGSGNSP